MANLKPGFDRRDDVIIAPTLSDTDAAKRFPQGWRALKPYLRLTPDPRLQMRTAQKSDKKLLRTPDANAQKNASTMNSNYLDERNSTRC